MCPTRSTSTRVTEHVAEYASVHTRNVQLGDVELAVAEAGEGGRPLLLLHGFAGAKEDFTDWLEALAALGWHAVVPDHRGHGESSKPTDVAAYSLSILAADSVALVDALGWGRFALLGHSMGGFVAQITACTHPSRLLGLILMDTGHGPVHGIDPEYFKRAVSVATGQGMGALADLMAEVDSPLDTPAHRRLVDDRPDYAQFQSRKLRATSPFLYSAIGHELLTYSDSLQALTAMNPPPTTLVLVGEQDPAFLESSHRMAEALPRATLAVVPDAGHSPQFENPGGWWKAVSSFLATIG